MPLTPNFSCTQSLAYPNQLTFTDLSTGSDGTIVTRRVSLITATGKWLTVGGVENATEAYTLWPYPIGTGITLSLLTRMTSPSVRVEWWSSTAKVVEKTIPNFYNIQGYLLAYSLTRGQISNPEKVSATDFYNNKIKLLAELKCSEIAITRGSDIVNSQAALERAQIFIDNQNDYF